MAEADLDVIIRALAKQPNKGLMEAAKKRHDRFMALAASAKDKETKERYKQIAKDTVEQGTAAARRLPPAAMLEAKLYGVGVLAPGQRVLLPAEKPVAPTVDGWSAAGAETPRAGIATPVAPGPPGTAPPAGVTGPVGMRAPSPLPSPRFC